MPKTREDKEQRFILAKEGKYPPLDQTYSQYKIKDKTSCLSGYWERFILVTLRGNWYNTYQVYLQKGIWTS